MRTLLCGFGLWMLPALPVSASSLDNESGTYTLAALPAAAREAERMDRMQLEDQQPAGLHLRKGERVRIHTQGLPADFELTALVGFRPMWNVQQGQQETPLEEGETRFRADQDGPLFFRFNPPPGRDGSRAEVHLSVDGGQPLPLYVDGEMDAEDWAAELQAHGDAPFVQLLGARALITLPADVHAREPIADPAASFAIIDTVIDRQDELAGFDGSSRRNAPTRLRVHYLVDFRVSAADRQNFYMYATDGFIGMLDDNTADLTDPDRLRQEWGIWHETGHTHQQNSWTFEALGEVNVNLFSLYVQEGFREPSQLALESDEAPTFLARARDYLDAGAPDFLAEPPDDDDGSVLFIKLVMFHQLKEAYGWGAFQSLHQHFRANPLPEDADDAERVDAFVEALCAVTANDLRSFFAQWGLRASAAADARIEQHDYPLPEVEIAEIFD